MFNSINDYCTDNRLTWDCLIQPSRDGKTKWCEVKIIDEGMKGLVVNSHAEMADSDLDFISTVVDFAVRQHKEGSRSAPESLRLQRSWRELKMDIV